MLDENLNWKEHVRQVEDKIAKNIELLYRAKYLINESSLKCIYFVYIHSYLNYASVAWASTFGTKLEASLKYIKNEAFRCY